LSVLSNMAAAFGNHFAETWSLLNTSVAKAGWRKSLIAALKALRHPKSLRHFSPQAVLSCSFALRAEAPCPHRFSTARLKSCPSRTDVPSKFRYPRGRRDRRYSRRQTCLLPWLRLRWDKPGCADGGSGEYLPFPHILPCNYRFSGRRTC